MIHFKTPINAGSMQDWFIQKHHARLLAYSPLTNHLSCLMGK